MNAKALIAATLILIVSWTGTFLHDLDEIGVLTFLSRACEQSLEPASYHDHDFCDLGINFKAPDPHEHDPYVLSYRNLQIASVDFVEAPTRIAWVFSHEIAGHALSYASQERPPPFRPLPVYLLYHAMLI